MALRPNRLQIENRPRRGHRMALHSLGLEINEEPPFSMGAVVDLVRRLAPDVGPDVVERPGVPGIPGHLMLGVVMTQRDIGPVLQVQLSAIDDGAAVVGGDMAERILALDFEVGHEDLVLLGPFRMQRGRLG